MESHVSFACWVRYLLVGYDRRSMMRLTGMHVALVQQFMEHNISRNLEHCPKHS